MHWGKALTDLHTTAEGLTSTHRVELRERLWDLGLPTDVLGARTNVGPASLTQRRMAFLHELAPDSPNYNSPASCRLTGPLDEVALLMALEDLHDRHVVLRMTLHVRDGIVVQQVRPAPPRLPVVDLTGLPAEIQRRSVDALAMREQHRPFSLENGPLARFHLLRLSAKESVLLATFHHAVFDGWSVNIFARDLTLMYEARTRGGLAELPSLPVDYFEYAAWQQDWIDSDAARGQLERWTSRLAGAPERITLPVDRPCGRDSTRAGASCWFFLNRQVRERLATLADASNCTLFMVLLAAFAVVLSRYSGEQEIVVGSPVANRRHRRLLDLIGFFANSVALRVEVDPAASFNVLLQQVRDLCLDAYEDQDLPLDVLARHLHPDRDPGGNPFYQVNFTLHNTPEPLRTAAGLVITPFDLDLGAARFDLDLNVWERDGRLECQLVYATDLFDEITALQLARSIRTVVETALEHPTRPTGALPLLPTDELREALSQHVGPKSERGTDLRIHRLFTEQARRTPDLVALRGSGDIVTYRELDQLSDRFAFRLTTQGISRGDVVVVFLPRTPALLVAVLGIMKAGAAFLTVDPAQPHSRLDYILRDSEAVLVVGPGDLQIHLPVLGVSPLDEGCLDEPWTLDARRDRTAAGASDADLVYVLYTSGSSGGAKGVMLSHHQVANYLLWAVDAYGLREGAGAPLHSSVGFDLTVTTLLAPLLVGQQILFSPDTGVPGESLVHSAAVDDDVSMVKLTPSHLRLLDDARVAEQRPHWTRLLVIGGEDLRHEHLRAWFERPDRPRIINEYGPTETAVACAFHEYTGVPTPRGRVPIGRAIACTQLYVLDEDMQPVPMNATGELYVGGDGVAYGYWRRPAMTAECFLPDPFSDRPGMRLYRTGDRVRTLSDGTLEYIGRLDDQLKVRGHRIEPAEIIATLEADADVDRAQVVLDDFGHDPELVAFVIPSSDDKAAGESSQAPAEEHHVSQWRGVYDDTYSGLGSRPTIEDDLVGWTSTFTGEPIPALEMAEWRDNTVERILGLRPRRLVEIGCGTGMVLTGVLPACSAVCGTDVSAAALEYTRRKLDNLVLKHDSAPSPELELRTAAAHEALRAGDRFDCVVLNSVVQYFPSADYLQRVLERAVEAIGERGHVFVGDVRHLGLLEAFHLCSVARKVPPSTTVGQMRAELQRRLDTEEELCLAPQFFLDQVNRLPSVTGVRVLPKLGMHDNELTAFRYDVVLVVGGSPPSTAVSWTDWSATEGCVTQLAAKLERERPPQLSFTRVPNARLAPALALRRALAKAPTAVPATVVTHPGGEPGPATADIGADTQVLQELADAHGYHVEFSWCRGDAEGAFDVLFTADQYRDSAAGVRWPSPVPAPKLANDPLWQPRASAQVTRLAARIRNQLPPSVIPAHFVPLRSMPLTVNGKVDLPALAHLARIRRSMGGSYAIASAPGEPPASLTETENRIAEIWRELLGVSVLSSTDDFFDLGGHSLLTFRLVARLREAFDVDVPVRAPFDAPTLQGLAEAVDVLTSQAVVRLPRIVPVTRTERMPTSFAQEQFWFMHQLNPDSVEYTFPIYVRLEGNLNVGALTRAFDRVVVRHESLRTVIAAEDGRPYQRVLPHRPLQFPLIDLSGIESERAEIATEGFAQGWYRRPVDLAHASVLSGLLIRSAESRYVLLITVHHVALDGWSVGLLMDEVTESYRAHVERRPADLPVLSVQYVDYAQWQRGLSENEYYNTMRTYWSQALEGVDQLPGLQLDHPRSAEAVHPGRRVSFEVPAAVAKAFRSLCAEEDATIFMGLVAVTHALICLRTGSTDVVAGTDVAGRPERAAEPMIGFFVNQIVLRGDLSGGPSWRELLRRTRARTLEAFEHQELPYAEAVRIVNPKRGPNRSPLFQVKLVLNATPEPVRQLPGVTVVAYDLDLIDTSRFDVSIILHEERDQIVGFWEYDTDLFNRGTVAELRTDFSELIRLMVEAPDVPFRNMP
jgi:amino acid adenylation domain-containing protein